jgi:hypothetical protein
MPDELMAIDAEISELQRENIRVESQMMRLKSDISAIETHLNHNDRVCRLRYYFPVALGYVYVRYMEMSCGGN